MANLTLGQEDEAEGMKRGSVIIVGVKEVDSPEARELLSCTLSNLVEAGDSVIAFHVSSPSSSSPSSSTSSVLQPHSIMGVYESNKKVELEVKVAENHSVKKALIEEARKTNATKMVLGGKPNLRPSFSLAKYCLRRLPSTCLVIVIWRGEVAFQREGYLMNDDDSCRVLCTMQRPIRNHIKRFEDQNKKSRRPLQIEIKQRNAHTARQQLRKDASIHEDTYTRQHYSDSKDQSPDETGSPSPSHSPTLSSPSPSSVCSAYSFVSDLQIFKGSQRHCLRECKPDQGKTFNEEHCLPQDLREKENLDSLHVGWPLLRRSTTMMKENVEHLQCHRMSVIEWALQLPDRPKEKLDPKYIFPMKVEQYRIHNDYVSKEQWRSIGENASRDDVSQCDGNTVALKVELVCHNANCREFHSLELQAATDNFSTSNIVGKGGCSEVYRGILLDGTIVAVKCINALAADAVDEFVTEVEIVSSLSHRNIVQLIGYGFGSDCYYLVYNFAPEGNLEHKLHDGNAKEILPWNARYRVAIGIAEALKYLHDGCERSVIHRDVKSSNILLTSGLEPQLTDFGLAKWAPTSSSQITCSDVVGTFGYLAPEYFMFGKVSEKTDVFSFGVVLLELITGRKPIDNRHAKGEENLEVWARPLLEDHDPNFRGLVDPNLDGNYEEAQLRDMAIAASLCLRQSAQLRPRMSRVLKVLSGEMEEDLASHAASKHDELALTDAREDDGYDDDDDDDDDDLDDADADGDGMPNIRKHLSTLALLGPDDDDTTSQSSIEHSMLDISHSNKSLEDYLGGRFSRSSSFQ